MHQRLTHQRRDAGVVDDAKRSVVFGNQAVVPVARVRVEGDVGDKAKLGELFFDRAQRPANQIVLIERLGAGFVLERGFRVGKERDRGNFQLHRALGGSHRLVDAQPIDARHRGDRDALLFAFDEEQGPDQVVGG